MIDHATMQGSFCTCAHRPANERRYIVTSSLICWAHTQNYLCNGTCIMQWMRDFMIQWLLCTGDPNALAVSVRAILELCYSGVPHESQTLHVEMHWLAYVVIMVADALVPKWHQAISSHHADSPMAVHFKQVVSHPVSPRPSHLTCVLWHSFCGVKWPYWTTGCWRWCFSLEVVSLIPTWSMIISQFPCGLYAFPCAGASKLNQHIWYHTMYLLQ